MEEDAVAVVLGEAGREEAGAGAAEGGVGGNFVAAYSKYECALLHSSAGQTKRIHSAIIVP